MKDEAAVQELRKKWQRAAVLRQHAEMRARFGEQFVRAINEATSKALVLEDFTLRTFALSLEWPEDIRDAPGLVRAYVAGSDAARIMNCVGRGLGPLVGALGFHEKDYLGFACVTDFTVPSMVAIAASTMDSVLFHAEKPEIVVLVDCYGNTAEEQFSVVIQGRGIPDCVRECFSDCLVSPSGAAS
jgi:hypothetical protein